MPETGRQSTIENLSADVTHHVFRHTGHCARKTPIGLQTINRTRVGRGSYQFPVTSVQLRVSGCALRVTSCDPSGESIRISQTASAESASKMGDATEPGTVRDQFGPFAQAESRRGQGRKRGGIG